MVLPSRLRTIAVSWIVPFACLRALMVAMMELEETSRSCRLYVFSANARLHQMPTNPAEMSEYEKPIKIGISGENSQEKFDRRLSVASMMDWSDGV